MKHYYFFRDFIFNHDPDLIYGELRMNISAFHFADQ